MASEERQTRTVKLGERTVQFPSEELGQMEDSNHLLGDIDALRHELQQKGWVQLLIGCGYFYAPITQHMSDIFGV